MTITGKTSSENEFSFNAAGDHWLRLQNSVGDAYTDLALNDLWVDGSIVGPGTVSSVGGVNTSGPVSALPANTFAVFNSE